MTNIGRKCAVMQPTYLSWSGYYNLIYNADIFIFLDDVQYSKNSFYNRNRYPWNNEEGFQFITAPIKKSSLQQKIMDSYFVEEENWRKKHVLTLRHVYSKHPYFKEFFPVLEKAIQNPELNTLSKLSIGIIKEVTNFLGLNKEFLVSSELQIEGSRSERLLNFCKTYNCSTYLSPAGAKDYIEEDNVLPASGINVVYQNFICREYPQKGMDKFSPYMSMVDVIFNLGQAGAVEYIKAPI